MLSRAEELGSQHAQDGFQRIFFVGCGAPRIMMKALTYWGERFAHYTDIRVYHSAEFIHQDFPSIDAKTIVFLESHSGTIGETVEAAKHVRSKPCLTLAVTQDNGSPLAKIVHQTLAYGVSKQGYFSSLIITFAWMSAFLSAREPAWTFHRELMSSLRNLPTALADAREANRERAMEEARLLKNAQLLYVVGAGPMFTTAYVLASCFLMEMQWMHAHPLSAADFFHGPLEVVDASTPLILLIGEDPSRPIAERVRDFCEKFAPEAITYNSREFDMRGIHKAVRPMVAPFILDAALTSLVEELSILRNHPLSTRRHLSLEEY